jgi:ABC-type transport system involved in multi-copper enzyme maturation permease subunit
MVVRVGVLSQFLSMGLYVAGFIIAFLAIFSSCGAISSEIEVVLMMLFCQNQ